MSLIGPTQMLTTYQRRKPFQISKQQVSAGNTGSNAANNAAFAVGHHQAALGVSSPTAPTMAHLSAAAGMKPILSRFGDVASPTANQELLTATSEDLLLNSLESRAL